MNSRFSTATIEKLRKAFLIVCSGFVLVWSAGLFAFLMAQNGLNDTVFYEILNWNHMRVLLASFFSFCMAGSGYYLAVFCIRKIQNQRYRFLILGAAATAVFLFFALQTPFSPVHDSNEMMGFLEQAMTQYNSYATAYLSFTATNRLTQLIYLPLSFLTGSISAGVQILNILLLLGTFYLFVGAGKRMFGERIAETALFFLLPVFPFLLLTGPYIYPPAVYLSALALFFYHGGSIEKWLSYLTCGFLFILRPTALGPILVYLFCDLLLIRAKRIGLLKSIGSMVMILFICFGVKYASGAALYVSGMHPYPGLLTSADVWTLELGTRMQGEKTGICTYSAFSTEFDTVSSDIHKLWEYYAKADKADTETIRSLNAKIKSDIWERTKQTVLNSPKNLAAFLSQKYVNLFSDLYKPYYYGVNAESEEFETNLYRNYEQKYFLAENVLLVSFCVSGVLMSLYILLCIKKKKRCGDGVARAFFLTLGAILICIVFILSTEVAKRYLFDCFVPMALAVLFCAGKLTLLLQNLKMEKKRALIQLGIFAISAYVSGVCYNSENIKPFQDMTVEKQNDMDITFRLKAPIPKNYFLKRGEEVTDLQGKQEFTIEQMKRQEYIYFILPDGTEYPVIRQRIIP